jgi:hypothetical protein
MEISGAALAKEARHRAQPDVGEVLSIGGTEAGWTVAGTKASGVRIEKRHQGILS